jgi:hypothetical protein
MRQLVVPAFESFLLKEKLAEHSGVSDVRLSS